MNDADKLERIARLPFVLLMVTSICIAAKDPATKHANLCGIQEEEARTFLSAVQEAVANDNQKALSSMVAYPITLVDLKGKKVKVRNVKEFLRFYPTTATGKWKGAVHRQRYEDLFCNWRGIMIGRGELWFSGICKDQTLGHCQLKIVALNPWFAD